MRAMFLYDRLLFIFNTVNIAILTISLLLTNSVWGRPNIASDRTKKLDIARPETNSLSSASATIKGEKKITTGIDPLRLPFRTNKRFIDLRDLLTGISQKAGISLMVCRNVHGIVDKIEGSNIEEILRETLHPRGFDWRLYDGCLYVSDSNSLKELWNAMQKPLKAKITTGKRLNADFRDLDLPTICKILGNFAGIDIRTTEQISGNMTMRIIDMPWEQVLRAVVYLNGFHMLETDFSILIAP